MATISNLSEYRAAKRSEEFVVAMVRIIYRSVKDGYRTVGYLAEICRNPGAHIPKHDKTILQIHGLVERDGSVSESVRRVILSRHERAKATFGW
jgi:hypothetical protein